MTNKERLEANNEKIKAIQETLNGKILSVNQEYIDLLKQIADGTLEEFDNKKVGVTSLAPYRFHQFTNLNNADFTGISVIPQYLCRYCSNLGKIVLDKNVVEIGDYAFANCSNLKTNLNINSKCTIKSYGFNQSGIESISGVLGDIQTYAFSSCNNLKNINVTIDGSAGGNAFSSNYYVESFKISKNSNVTQLLDYCFNLVGTKRENPENNIFDLDFSNSTFDTISGYVFSGTSSNLFKHAIIKLPTTLKTIKNYGFRYMDNVELYFKSIVPPTLSGSSSFSYITNCKIFVPYDSISVYRTATNWVNHTNYIYGYTNENYFKEGERLPKYLIEGYELTWYSDKELTNQVTSVENANQVYYCSVGTEQIEVMKIDNVFTNDCAVTIKDSVTGYEYSSGEILLAGTELTISATSTVDGYIPYLFTLNGDDISNPYTYTTINGVNINLVAVYYNGVDIPIKPEFAENDWVSIKRAVQSGNIGAIWRVGSVKEIEIDGLTYGIRLSDVQAGRYQYANEQRKTNAVFEFVQLWDTTTRMNNGQVGWASCELRTKINSDYLEKFPSDLRDLLEEVIIASADGGGTKYTGITTSPNKLFIPCASEVALSTTYGRSEEGTVWDYYVENVNSLRIKTKPNSTSASVWWLRSPYPARTDGYSTVNTSGAGSFEYGYQGTPGTCLCFAW